MARKYNLALVPLSKNYEITAIAQKLSCIADQYLLGVNSLSHLTLYQFEAEEKTIADIWQRVCNQWKEKPINLALNELSHITFDDSIYWISFLPTNRDILFNMHCKIASILELPIKKTFDPHVTLINTKNNERKKIIKFLEEYKPVMDIFILALGESDHIGQLTGILYWNEVVSKEN